MQHIRIVSALLCMPALTGLGCHPLDLLLAMAWLTATYSETAAQTPAQSTAPLQPVRTEEETEWYDARAVGVDGQGWPDTDAPYDRLPARARDTVRDDVWELSRRTSGLSVGFVTDSPRIDAHWDLRSPSLAMPHMAATGVSGLDLYVREEGGPWRWLAIGRPTAKANTSRLVQGLPPGEREYRLYFPLYNGVETIEIGVEPGRRLTRRAPRRSTLRPVVFYGTSITQGGCASRPGMVHTSILGRRLEVLVINLGFSGNGRMELAISELMAELDASVYVIDCLPNITAGEVTERTEPFVRRLRESHSGTPIVLVEDRTYADAFLVASKRDRNDASRKALRSAYERLRDGGDEALYYIEGDDLLGTDGEATVDSSHPTDLGFLRQADAFEGVLSQALLQRSTAIFDGRTLHGWKTSGGSPSQRAVEAGALRPRGCGDYMLVWEHPLADFELEVEFLLEEEQPGGSYNSGVFFRTASLDPRPGKDVGYNGLEVAIDFDPESPSRASYHDTGAIYDLVRPRRNAMKPPGQWNRMVVVADGPLVEVELNDELVTTLDLDEWPEPNVRPDGSRHKFDVAYRDHPRSGYIGFQDHGAEIAFRNIRVTPLSNADRETVRGATRRSP